MDQLTNKQCLSAIVFTIIAVVIFIWIIYPMFMGFFTEPFNSNNAFDTSAEAQLVQPPAEAEGQGPMAEGQGPMAEGQGPMAEGQGPVAEQPSGAAPEEMINQESPYVDPQTGMVIDGPGFEKGDDKDVYTPVPSQIPSNYYFLDDGAQGTLKIENNLCSPSCCSEQWPTPFKQKYDPYVCQNKDKFIPSRIFCNNSFQDSGCLCLTKKQGRHLYNRGGNGREWF